MISVIPLARTVEGDPAVYFAYFRAKDGTYVFRRGRTFLGTFTHILAIAKDHGLPVRA